MAKGKFKWFAKSSLNSLPFGLGKWLLSQLSIFKQGLKVSPFLAISQPLLNDWNDVVDFFSRDYITSVLKRDMPLCLYLLQHSVLLRRYEDASRFYEILSSSESIHTAIISRYFSLSKLVISEIEELTEKNFSGLNNRDLKASKAGATLGSQHFEQYLLELIHEHERLDCVWTNQYNTAVQRLQEIQFSRSSLIDGKYHVVYLDSSWFDSVGHFYYLDSLIKGVVLGLIPIKFIFFGIDTDIRVSNQYLYSKYLSIAKEYGILWSGGKVDRPPVLYMWAWPDNQGNLVDNTLFAGEIQDTWLESGLNYFELLPPSEIIEYESILFDCIKIHKKEIVTFHVRQPSFKSENRYTNNVRNSDPKPIFDILSGLTNSSLHFVMLGDEGMSTVPEKYRENIFDYPHSKLKSEKFDAFLIQYSKAHIGTLSGISHLPCVFGRPTLIVNTYTIFSAISTNTTYVPKLYRSSDGNFLGFRDFYNQFKPIVHYGGSSALKNISISMHDNTYEDLRNSIISFLESVFRVSPLQVIPQCSAKASIVESSDSARYNSSIFIEKSFYEKYSDLFIM